MGIENRQPWQDELEERGYQWIQGKEEEYPFLFPLCVEVYAPNEGVHVPATYGEKHAGKTVEGVVFDMGGPWNAWDSIEYNEWRFPSKAMEERWEMHVEAFGTIMAETDPIIYLGPENGSKNVLPRLEAGSVFGETDD